MKRRRGRPPLDDADPSVDVHLRLPSKQYDETYARAQRQRTTVPEIIRQDLQEAERTRQIQNLGTETRERRPRARTLIRVAF